ncbi:MAG: hypothetical protein M1827_000983 [Pycnora praestabilis]|nr:MAG: hypothetical protein M1827_000983 [Pycnora praestabilis]
MSDWLVKRNNLTRSLHESPYDLVLYIQRSSAYEHLGFPDLAAGDAYRALLLTDEVHDECSEYHEQAGEALQNYRRAQLKGWQSRSNDYHANGQILENEIGEMHLEGDGPEHDSGKNNDDGERRKLALRYSLTCYQVLARSLSKCGCFKSAFDFCKRGLIAFPEDETLSSERDHILKTNRHTQKAQDSEWDEAKFNLIDLPDQGSVRRELYPWNDHEPDRFSTESLQFLNNEMSQVAPKCEVLATTLPLLTDHGEARDSPPIKQLGIFATEDIAQGEVVLQEMSILTANNRLHESLCDACSSALPDLTASSTPEDIKAAAKVTSCSDCDDTLFCDEKCLGLAMESYHPAVCEKDVDAIGKDTDPREAANALYLLLLARTLAMSSTQDCHPLQLASVKYIWGDFIPPEIHYLHSSSTTTSSEYNTSRHLPFSFTSNILSPLHVLEKMNIDIYAELWRYDTWVLNTLYAKFRGTASARLSLRDGRPEVSAVHPMWCLANHSCDPNVGWEWGGEVRFWAREKRTKWGERGGGYGKGKEQGNGRGEGKGGIKKGEEILNHYCDIDLPVKERREWAIGALGGLCMCERCRWEAGLPTVTTSASAFSEMRGEAREDG